MTPPMPFKVVNLVDQRAVDSFIETHLERPWSLQQNGFFGQETLVQFDPWPEPEATAIVEEWLASPEVPCPGRLNQEGFGESVHISTDEILNELCNRELLPEEKLWVWVWW